ncbi:MAG: hypothetical protein JNM86_05755 [Phycisphaerae bacterium]|nr:hypothetical protein [Phycisphaerae bacterium]
MKMCSWIAIGALAVLGGHALAQTPMPITNGSFEDDDPLFGGLLGYNVLPGAAVNTQYHRTGSRSVGLGPGALNNFIGITTDAVNFYEPGFPYYDVSIDWLGGNVRATMWYLIPGDAPVAGGGGGIKLDVKLFNQNYGTLDGLWDIQGNTGGQWVKYEVVWNKADMKQRVWINATENCDGGCFVNNGPPPYGVPPYPSRVKVTPARWNGTSGGGAGSNTIYIDDLSLTQDHSCPADFNGDDLVDDADFTMFAPSYDLLIDFRCDLNGDGLTDDADFAIFASAYNDLICAE